jgi:hypothetical protein
MPGDKDLPKQANFEDKMRLYELRLANFNVHAQAVFGFANVTINSLILANSAAAGALLAFLATLWGSPVLKAVAPDASVSLWTFAIGVTASMLCGAASYFAQLGYGQVSVEGEWDPGDRWWIRFGLFFHGIAIATGLVGLVSFPVGAWTGLSALSHAIGSL